MPVLQGAYASCMCLRDTDGAAGSKHGSYLGAAPATRQSAARATGRSAPPAKWLGEWALPKSAVSMHVEAQTNAHLLTIFIVGQISALVISMTTERGARQQ